MPFAVPLSKLEALSPKEHRFVRLADEQGEDDDAYLTLDEIERYRQEGAQALLRSAEIDELRAKVMAALPPVAAPTAAPTHATSPQTLHPALLVGRAMAEICSGKAVLTPRASTTREWVAVAGLQSALLELEVAPVQEVDGLFGPDTRRALRAFQRQHGLPERNELNRDTLLALDAALKQKSATKFQAIDRLSPLNLPARAHYAWAHEDVQQAFGRFVTEYWPTLTAFRVETDCRGLVHKVIDEFRNYVFAQTGFLLRWPGSTRNVQRPNVRIARELRTTLPSGSKRADYQTFRRLMAHGASPSLLSGPNHVYRGVNAHALATTMIQPRADMVQDHAADMATRVKRATPEVDVQRLRPGDIISIDHRNGGRSYDHTVLVVDVVKNDQDRVTRLVLGVSAFDDLRDQSAATAPVWPDINFYTEEVVVDIDEAGTATSRVTYSSDPTYVPTRYSHHTTLAELSEGGVLRVGRPRD